jgi:hypothetical protein
MQRAFAYSPLYSGGRYPDSEQLAASDDPVLAPGDSGHLLFDSAG